MSVSSLPEWKQLLLERKRREEEERGRREKQEEEKFASMPAWKRGIIQRRKAKQDVDKEKDVCLLYVEGRSPSEGLSDTDSSLTNYWGSEMSTSPGLDPGWLDAELKPVSQVSVETIVPVHENPFIRTQSSWRKGRDSELGHAQEAKDRDKERVSPRNQDGEPGRGRDIESKIERFRDLSEGRQGERSRDRSQGREQENSRGRGEKDRIQRKESGKGAAREWDLLRGRKSEEEKESETVTTSLPPHVSCLRTIRADNIIIIEQDRDERRGRQREVEEKNEEDHPEKSGMKMDLREIFGAGGSITEIRASEVLIIKPPESPEDGTVLGRGQKSREDGEMKVGMEGRWESPGRELRSDLSWLREKEKPWGQATLIKEDRKDSSEDNVFIDRGGRVSQLLSKFGEHPKPPSRSKSSDNFIPPPRRKHSDEDEDQWEGNGRNVLLRGVPKRSFSFSDRVLCAKENGLGDKEENERKRRDRIHSDRSVEPWFHRAGLGNESSSRGCCGRPVDRERPGNGRDRRSKKNDEATDGEKSRHADEDEGFTVASVRSTEGISFARRVAIRQEGRARADREMKLLAGDRKTSAEAEEEGRTLSIGMSGVWRDEGLEAKVSADVQKSQVPAESAAPAQNHLRRESAFTHSSHSSHSSTLLPSVTNSSSEPHGGLEWKRSGPQSHCALSKQTEELISKIEKLGDVSVSNSQRIRRIFKGTLEMTTETKQGVHGSGESGSENHVVPRSPKGAPAEPLEFHIPTAVFYVAEETEKRPNKQPREQEEHKGVERRDSWRIGKPLSRIESLREKIRQRELEKQRQNQGGGEGGGDEEKVSQQAEGGDHHREAEEADLQSCSGGAESTRQSPEEAAEQTSETADVAPETSCPQLPASAPHSQADRGEVEASGDPAAGLDQDQDPNQDQDQDKSQDHNQDQDQDLGCSESFQTAEDEDNLLRHEDQPLNSHWDQGGHREEREEGDAESSEEELEEKTSPPHPNSLAAMSRIYNLDTVGSRSGLCLRDKPVDIPAVHLLKVRPLRSNVQHGDGKAFSGGDVSGGQVIQRQMEQLQLKEPEPLTSRSAAGSTTRRHQSPREQFHQQEKSKTKTQEEDEETSEVAQRVQSPSSVVRQWNQTSSISPSTLRGQVLDNSLRASDCTQTPAPSPSSPSPAASPSVSPSPSPSPTLFSIRSASGGKVKRGATITITPRKAGAVGPEGGSTAAELGPSTTAQQAHTSSAGAEPARKKYPTVEEIQVIGGYQSLEKSCLLKNRVMVKRVSRLSFCSN